MLTSLFGKGPFLDPDVEEWHLEAWSLLLERLPEVPLADIPVAVPTREYFPPSEAVGHARAEHVFDCVRTIMGMSPDAWPCRLEAQHPRVVGAQVAEFVSISGDNDPNGTFRIEADGTPVITYAPDLLDDPTSLVATFAHELAHYLLAHELDLVEDETHELMTDLTVVYTGLGVFGANACFSFEQHGDAFSQGWRSRGAGYLSPRSWAFALATFAALKGSDGGMLVYLKPELARLTQDATKYLGRNPALLAPLRA